MLKKTILCLALILIVTSCIPFPHIYRTAPKVDGVVLNNGEPVRNTVLHLNSRTGLCNSEGSIKTVTDENGRFSFGPIWNFGLITFFIGDPIYGWSLSVDRDSKEVPIAQEGGLGILRGGTRKIICRLDKLPEKEGLNNEDLYFRTRLFKENTEAICILMEEDRSTEK